MESRMVPHEVTTTVISVVGFAVVALCSIPAFFNLAFRLCKKRKPSSKIYEDRDGIATEATTAEYSVTVNKFFICLLSGAGLGTAIFLGILDVLNHRLTDCLVGHWLNVGSWGLLFSHSFIILFEGDSVRVFNMGAFASISCVAIFIVTFLEDRILLHQLYEIGRVKLALLRTSLFVLPVLSWIAHLCIPRRPVIFEDGKPVDGMYTGSALSRYSFAWCEHLLILAGKKALLQDNLPRLGHKVRSRELSEAWRRLNRSYPLWINIILEYKWALIKQWGLALVQAILNFAPPFVLFHILRVLEARGAGKYVANEAWFWVLALGVVAVLAAWIESWLLWVSWSNIAIPLRAQLSALIFEKSMRRKNVVNTPRRATENQSTNDSEVVRSFEMDGEPIVGKQQEPEENHEQDEATLQESHQSTVNLIGVDTSRVSDFGSYVNYIPGSVFKVIAAIAFLITLIGWESLLAGLGAMALTLPINLYFSRKYLAAQDRLMKVRDSKVSVATEALRGIRQIKFSAMEDLWQAKITVLRDMELSQQWKVFLCNTMLLFCWISGPVLAGATSLAVYAVLHGGLSPSVAFTSIGIFRQLEITLAVLPELTTDLVDAWISIGRIDEYLNAPEMISLLSTQKSQTISFTDVSVAWPSDDNDIKDNARYILHNLNLSFPANELSVVSGKTGTGKSLLLASIIGEIDLLAGNINVPERPTVQERCDDYATADTWIIPSSVAFVAQTPWIEAGSIRENILFGLPYIPKRYEKTVDVCALSQDLAILPDGDSTEIGANGINLSGGQRWRIAFARALYSRAGVLILDDILSAVDAHVGRHIFEQGLVGELGAGRTRILATHHVALCRSKAKYIIELCEGGAYKTTSVDETKQGYHQSKLLMSEDTNLSRQDRDGPNDNEEQLRRQQLGETRSKATAKQFIEAESHRQGAIKRAVYVDYLNSTGGWRFWIVAAVIFSVQVGVTLGSSWVLRLWTGTSSANHNMNSVFVYDYQKTVATFNLGSVDSTILKHYLPGYIGLSLLGCFLGTLRFAFIYTGSIRASRTLFERLNFIILRTPLRWIDTVPLGRILNRFTTDFNIIDSRLANGIAYGAESLFDLVGVIIPGIIVTPYSIIVVLLFLLICYHFATRYLAGAREVKRLESNAKSPVLELFSSNIPGVGTIRAFDKSQLYISRMYQKIDDHATAFWHLWLFNRWMGFRISVVGALFSASIAAFVVSAKNIDAPLAGFALAFTLEFTVSVVWAIRHYTDMEMNMNAAERVIEYTNLVTESQLGMSPPAAWPFEGRIEVSNLVLGYSPELPPVLRGISFRLERNERVGVVGRTGAGKSSLTLALFRFLEAREGLITIDGLDISKIKLHDLRSRLAIVPQDPVLFSGTLRNNLDPFDRHTDFELKEALQRVGLMQDTDLCDFSDSNIDTYPGPTTANTNKNPLKNLEAPITEGGRNISQGQRQLICLAIAIIARPKIMILDEATSAVDIATDAIIQKSIREEFCDRTLIVIAHRLSTIVDFDKILVIEDGKLAEFGTPRELYCKSETGIFAEMVRESGDRDALRESILSDGCV